jgi:hypothetical protein
LGEKHRATRPPIWEKTLVKLLDTLKVTAATLRLKKTQQERRKDTAGLPNGVKSHMLKNTAPATTATPQQFDEAAQAAKAEDTFTKIWNQEKIAKPEEVEVEDWIKEHALEAREKIGDHKAEITVDKVRAALRFTSGRHPGSMEFLGHSSSESKLCMSHSQRSSPKYLVGRECHYQIGSRQAGRSSSRRIERSTF